MSTEICLIIGTGSQPSNRQLCSIPIDGDHKYINLWTVRIILKICYCEMIISRPIPWINKQTNRKCQTDKNSLSWVMLLLLFFLLECHFDASVYLACSRVLPTLSTKRRRSEYFFRVICFSCRFLSCMLFIYCFFLCLSLVSTSLAIYYFSMMHPIPFDWNNTLLSIFLLNVMHAIKKTDLKFNGNRLKILHHNLVIYFSMHFLIAVASLRRTLVYILFFIPYCLLFMSMRYLKYLKRFAFSKSTEECFFFSFSSHQA